jgi:hypothetical protein
MTDGLRERDQIEVAARELRLLVLLGTARTSRTWLAVSPDGEMTVARRMASSGAGCAALMARLEAARGVDHPHLVPPAAVWTAGTALWVSRRHQDGVSLRRLIAVTRLAPAHLLSVADDTLSALVALHAAAVAHGSLHPGNILIAPNGMAVAVDTGCRAGEEDGEADPDPGERDPTGRSGSPSQDLAVLAAGMRSALTPPGRRAARAGIAAEVPAALAVLLGGKGGPPFDGAATAPEALAAVRAALGGPSPGARRQLGALVVPLQHERLGLGRAPQLGARPPSRLGPDGALRHPFLPRPEDAAAPAPAPQMTAPGPARRRRIARARRGVPFRRRWAAAVGERARSAIAGAAETSRQGTLTFVRHLRRGATGAAAAVEGRAAAMPRLSLPRLSPRSRVILWALPAVAAVVTAGVALAITPHHAPRPAPAVSTPTPIPGGVAATQPPVAHGATSTPSPSTRSAPPAPPTAGDVAGLNVTLASPAGCTAAPGRSCLLRVTVDLAPHPFETVAWDLMVVDTCTGSTSTAAGASVPASAAYAYVWGESPVTFATADPVRLYAVTSAPARAASQALPVAGGGAAC